jgi:hypothetical protein
MSFQGAVVADIDGDGADELLHRTGAGVLSALNLRENGGKLLWTVKLPANTVNTIVTDVGGDGKPELVAACTDGSVVALGK